MLENVRYKKKKQQPQITGGGDWVERAPAEGVCENIYINQKVCIYYIIDAYINKQYIQITCTKYIIIGM